MTARQGCLLFVLGVIALAILSVIAGVVAGLVGEDPAHPSPLSWGLALAPFVVLLAVPVWRGITEPAPPPKSDPTVETAASQTGPHADGGFFSDCTASPRANGLQAERCRVCGEAPEFAGWRARGSRMVDVHERTVGPKGWLQRTVAWYHNFECGKCGSISTFRWTSWTAENMSLFTWWKADWRWMHGWPVPTPGPGLAAPRVGPTAPVRRPELDQAWRELNRIARGSWNTKSPMRRSSGDWVQYAFWTNDEDGSSRPVEVIGSSDVDVLHEMARCLREIGEGRVSK